MRTAHLVIITGLPGAGKTTLAHELARRYEMPLIGKDVIKEPLLDVLGAADPQQSRKLSDASFAVMFALARELVAARASAILEGNFRAGEHEVELRSAISSVSDPGSNVRLAQILCVAHEPERIARLEARQNDPSRHTGHRDAQMAGQRSQTPGAFLNLPGERFVFDSGERERMHERTGIGKLATNAPLRDSPAPNRTLDARALTRALDEWFNLHSAAD